MHNSEEVKLSEIKQILDVISFKVAVPLYFLFWFLDLIYVPQYKWEFLGIRFLILPTAFITHWWLKSTSSIKQAEYAGLFLAFMCASILNAMIFIIGHGALYSIPLHLVAVGGLSFIPWTNRNFFIAIVLIYGPYIALEAYWTEQAESAAQFSVNMFFILGVIVLTWVIKTYREKMHALEVSMRIELEKEIDKRKEAEKHLIVARDSAIAATRAKESFLANMSHEIRTPLTAIIGFSDTALDHDQTTQQRISSLKIIRRSGDHLLTLVNDILDFSKIEAGELQAEKIVLNPLQQVYEVKTIIAGQAAKKGLKLEVDYCFPLPGKIKSDPVRIKQILLNLCNNAIKFTENGEIRIIVEYEPNGQQLIFKVKDTGIGISTEKQAMIFNAFKQADSSTARRYGGTGLGLSLSRQLAQILGGQLHVSSKIGQGSTFIFRLKIDETLDTPFFNDLEEVKLDSKETNADKPPQKQLKGKVLLVEDNNNSQELIKVYLQKMGASVICVNNGAAAVKMAEDKSYDLIYMDMQMPVLSGPDAVKILRDKQYSGPIVMLTANVSSDDKSLCLDAGANDFVTKPIVRQKLYETTARYLEAVDNTSNKKPIYSALLQEEPSFEDLLYNFMDSLRKMEEQIKHTFRNNEFYALAQVVHDLKGTAGGFGYPDLTRIAQSIETSLKEKNRDSTEILLQEMEVMCQRIYQGTPKH